MKLMDKIGKRIEWGIWLMLLGLLGIESQFAIFPAIASCFISGVVAGLMFMFIAVSLLPQEIYEKMPYRKWVKNRTNKQ